MKLYKAIAYKWSFTVYGLVDFSFNTISSTMFLLELSKGIRYESLKVGRLKVLLTLKHCKYFPSDILVLYDLSLISSNGYSLCLHI